MGKWHCSGRDTHTLPSIILGVRKHSDRFRHHELGISEVTQSPLRGVSAGLNGRSVLSVPTIRTIEEVFISVFEKYQLYL